MIDPRKPIDSRRWTGDLPPVLPRESVMGRLPRRYQLALFAGLISMIAFMLVETLTWYAAGQPIMFDHPETNRIWGMAALAGLAIALLLTDKIAEDWRIASGVLGFGVTLVTIHGTCLFLDLAQAKPIGHGVMFVEGIRLPGWGRHDPWVPTALVTGPDWQAYLRAPRAVLAPLVSGDTCATIEVRRGPYGATFVEMKPFSAGDGTGSPFVRDANRVRCLARGA